MQAKLHALIAEFPSNPFAISRSLRELRNSNIDEFPAWALQILANSEECSVTRFLATLVPLNDVVLERIANPAVFEEVPARRIVRALRAVDPQTETKLLRQISTNSAKPLPPATADRILDLVDSVTDGPRLVPVLMQIFRTANPYLRARLALSIGKHHRNKDWLEDRMKDTDSRVRANAVEANWGQADEQAMGLFNRALRDPHHRVIGNGAVGFYLAADVRALRVMADLLSNDDPVFRAAGVWAVGQVRDARFYPIVAALAGERDISIHRGLVVTLAKLKRQMESRAELPALQLRLIKATRNPVTGTESEFLNHLFIEVKNGAGNAVTGLKILDFALYENDETILDYSVKERTKYPKPGAYDLYFTHRTTQNAADDAGPAMVHIKIVASLESGAGELDSYTFPEQEKAPAAKPEPVLPPAESSWNALRG